MGFISLSKFSVTIVKYDSWIHFFIQAFWKYLFGHPLYCHFLLEVLNDFRRTEACCYALFMVTCVFSAGAYVFYFSFFLNDVCLQNLPEGKWSCASCQCGICGESEFNADIKQFTEQSILYCDQCERECMFESYLFFSYTIKWSYVEVSKFCFSSNLQSMWGAWQKEVCMSYKVGHKEIGFVVKDVLRYDNISRHFHTFTVSD